MTTRPVFRISYGGLPGRASVAAPEELHHRHDVDRVLRQP
jgi:hypothetical protein